MSVRENSLRIYDTKRTFFSKIGSTFSKIFEPTREGINNLIINSKRNNVLKGFKACQNVKDQKKASADRNFEMYYSLYMDAIDDLIINTIYKKVRNNVASEFEKDAMGRYYNIIHLKEDDDVEFRLRKQQYLLSLDFDIVKNTKKQKVYDEYLNFYINQQDILYKKLLKQYSMKMTEKVDINRKIELYDKIFEVLHEYVRNIVSLKKSNDEDIAKLYSMYETYEVGKLDQVDSLDKRMILIAMSRKLFTHSLPLVIAEKMYIRTLKDIRNLIVDTKIARKRENAYQLLLKAMEQYVDRLLAVKMYWNSDSDKNFFVEFGVKRKEIDNLRNTDHNLYDMKRQILFIKADMKFLKKYGEKYYRIIKFYKSKLAELGNVKCISNSYKKMDGDIKFIKVKVVKKEELNEAVC